MALRARAAFAILLSGAGLFLAACAAPEPSVLRSGSANGSALELGGKDDGSANDEGSSACAPSATGPDGTGPRDLACAGVAPAAPPAAAAPAAPAPVAPIQASIAVTRNPDDASNTNCLEM